MNTLRIALPGYDANKDTNLDHFALNTDEDNVLIKEKSRGSFTITGNGSGVTQTIPHNLGYVPFFLVYVFDSSSVINNNEWKLLAHNTAGASVPSYIAYADTTNLYVINFLAGAAGPISFKYYIFYDNVAGSSGVKLKESRRVIKIAKSGVNALSEKDPNNLIFHSDLNTFKIIKEGNGTINFSGTAGTYTFNHNSPIANPSAYLLFIKFPDGYAGLIPGKGLLYAKNSAYFIFEAYIDATQIGMYIGGSAVANTFSYKYYIFETPLT